MVKRPNHIPNQWPLLTAAQMAADNQKIKNSSETYTNAALSSANSHSDTNDTTTLNLAKAYTDTEIALSTYTPTFTFSTVGDLSVIYTTQTGKYLQFNKFGLILIRLSFTPTFTTSSGGARISTPLANANPSLGVGLVHVNGTMMSYPSGCTTIAAVPSSGNSFFNIVAEGSNTATAIAPANFTSGVAVDLLISVQTIFA